MFVNRNWGGRPFPGLQTGGGSKTVPMLVHVYLEWSHPSRSATPPSTPGRQLEVAGLERRTLAMTARRDECQRGRKDVQKAVRQMEELEQELRLGLK